MTLEPLRITFEVAVPRERAFLAWTEGIDAWWPRGHTQSADPDLVVVLEPALGGRIYERTPSGSEHDWGVITGWDPPAGLGYRWHLRRTPDEATDVTISFVALGPVRTRVDIEQSAWERLGADAEEWRERNRGGWAGLLPHYTTYVEGAPSDHRQGRTA